MEWVPTESALVENDVPEPMLPSRLEFQLRLAPRLPSSASLAEAAKPIEVPWTTEALSAGAPMFTTGAVLVPPAPEQILISSIPASTISPAPEPSDA